INGNLCNLFTTKTISKNFATIGSSGNYLAFNIPVVDGYKPLCIIAINLPANVGINFFNISGYTANVNFYGHVNNPATTCSIVVLYTKVL
ncbi:hypothetical protein, partial [Parablautia muri]